MDGPRWGGTSTLTWGGDQREMGRPSDGTQGRMKMTIGVERRERKCEQTICWLLFNILSPTLTITGQTRHNKY